MIGQMNEILDVLQSVANGPNTEAKTLKVMQKDSALDFIPFSNNSLAPIDTELGT